MGRAPCCEKVGLKKGRWTEEEDEILMEYIQANGEGSWRSLPKNAGLLRCGKSCRLRWINYLRTDLKRGNISAEEEDTIIKLHATLGNKWSLIASQLAGRTDNEIKNYWNSHLSRKIHAFRRPATIQTLPIILNLANKIGTGSKRKSSQKFTTIAGMKKNKTHPQTEESTLQEKKNESMVLDSLLGAENQEEERRPNLIVPGHFQEDTTGNIRERESLFLCHGEERETSKNSILFPIDERESAAILLGPYYKGGALDDSEVLSFSDMIGNTELLDPNGSLSSSCEQEKDQINYNVMMDSSKMVTSEEAESGNLSSNGESSNNVHELLSCSSTSYFDDHGKVDYWDWEGVVHGHNNQLIMDEQEDQMISCLWESDAWERDCQNFGEMEICEKQKAMVDWLLS